MGSLPTTGCPITAHPYRRLQKRRVNSDNTTKSSSRPSSMRAMSTDLLPVVNHE